MRHWLILFSCFSIFSQLASPNFQSAPAQNPSWEAFSIPLLSGGIISQMRADPLDFSHLYAIQEQTDQWQTLLKSQDGGEHWGAIANFQNLWIDFIEIDPVQTSVLYMGGGAGMYRSENSGADWTKIAAFGPMIVVPAADTIYSVERSDGSPGCARKPAHFVRSRDRGNTWEKILLNCGNYASLAISKSNPGIMYLRGGMESTTSPLAQMLAQSSDGGDTWSYWPLTGPFFSMGSSQIDVDPQKAEKLYSSSGTGIIVSDDSGHTWESPLSIAVIGDFLFSFSGDEIYAGLISIQVGTLGGVYHSRDGGETWEELPVSLVVNLEALWVDPVSSGTVYIGLDGYGIERSTDEGQTWQSINTGILSTTKVSQLVISPAPNHPAYAISDWPRPALFRSDNGGASWSGALIENEVLAVVTDPQQADFVWAVGQNGWMESQDGGKHWTVVSALSGRDLAVSADRPERPCASHTGQAQGFIVCRIEGEQGEGVWQSYPIPGSKAITQVAIHPGNGAIIFAGGTPDNQVGAVYQSKDGGNTWEESLRSQPGYVLLDLAVSGGNPAKVLAAFEQYFWDDLMVYESLDTGQTWRDVTPEINTAIEKFGSLWTGATYRAFAFSDASDTIYLITGNMILAKPRIGPWKIHALLDNRIYAAGIEAGSPGLFWLASERRGWKVPLPVYHLIWMPVLLRKTP